ncbi:hypothetical protein [Aquimarina sp. 2201CG14-23]|uniref:hypothetical protein n=1 Tax=Aquimarina mycalae TaxID=3040073 RepID=UPI002477D847|nr:hypothetical protein [Aquimarina sp. 2201CG14-23]MDH7444338.1 hypothetical protein [Aquimarina sp. 2201CG14-23]
MKTKLLSILLNIAFVGMMNADCTVSTPCGDRTYAVDSVSASNINGVVTVEDSEGNILDTFECDQNSVSTSCSSISDGDTDGNTDDEPRDFCDYIPDFFKPLFGC